MGFCKGRKNTFESKKNLKSVDGVLVVDDGDHFIRTKCLQKKCSIHLDYTFDTNTETWINEMVRYI